MPVRRTIRRRFEEYVGRYQLAPEAIITIEALVLHQMTEQRARRID